MIGNIFAPVWTRVFGGAALALAILAAVSWHQWGAWKDRATSLRKQAGTVVLALREASDNPKADWDTAPGQIFAMGASNRALKGEIEATNLTIDEMAREAVKLRAKAEELRQIAAKAEAQRRAAYVRLSDMAATPGQREDCMALLREAEEALDLVREAGL